MTFSSRVFLTLLIIARPHVRHHVMGITDKRNTIQNIFIHVQNILRYAEYLTPSIFEDFRDLAGNSCISFLFKAVDQMATHEFGIIFLCGWVYVKCFCNGICNSIQPTIVTVVLICTVHKLQKYFITTFGWTLKS